MATPDTGVPGEKTRWIFEKTAPARNNSCAYSMCSLCSQESSMTVLGNKMRIWSSKGELKEKQHWRHESQCFLKQSFPDASNLTAPPQFCSLCSHLFHFMADEVSLQSNMLAWGSYHVVIKFQWGKKIILCEIFLSLWYALIVLIILSSD